MYVMRPLYRSMPSKANSIVEGRLVVDRKLCHGCGACTEPDVCLAGTRKIEGGPMTVEEVMNQVVSDYSLYQNSGGGLTVSGGDCGLQPEFTAALLKAAHDNVINTCVEISGAFPWETIKMITDHADYIYYDLKCMDDKNIKRVREYPTNLFWKTPRNWSKKTSGCTSGHHLSRDLMTVVKILRQRHGLYGMNWA